MPIRFVQGAPLAAGNSYRFIFTIYIRRQCINVNTKFKIVNLWTHQTEKIVVKQERALTEGIGKSAVKLLFP